MQVSFCRPSVEVSKKALKQVYHCPETNSLKANDYLGWEGRGKGKGQRGLAVFGWAAMNSSPPFLSAFEHSNILTKPLDVVGSAAT